MLSQPVKFSSTSALHASRHLANTTPPSACNFSPESDDRSSRSSAAATSGRAKIADASRRIEPTAQLVAVSAVAPCAAETDARSASKAAASAALKSIAWVGVA